jgi:hypothetical protein
VNHPAMRNGTVRQGMAVFSAMALLILGFSSELGADTYPRQPGIDARHYAVRLRLLTSDSNEIQAVATVTLRIVMPGTREAILDLTSATRDGKGMTVTSVTSDGRVVPIEHRENRLHLPVPAGAITAILTSFAVTAARGPVEPWRGKPTDPSGGHNVHIIGAHQTTRAPGSPWFCAGSSFRALAASGGPGFRSRSATRSSGA